LSLLGSSAAEKALKESVVKMMDGNFDLRKTIMLDCLKWKY
jgi:hypothetical protein